jgi:hypothetical protein
VKAVVYYVKSEVLTSVSMNNTIARIVTPCSLVEVYWRSKLLGLLFDPKVGDSTRLRNVGKLLPGYGATHPSRWHSG